MDGGGFQTARIGPNAILQLMPVLDQTLGRASRRAFMATARVQEPPPDAGMWPQDQVVRLHRAVIEGLPEHAPRVLHQAGLATADYILANRIPAAARFAIRALPRKAGARLLAGAIARHSWTFAGSGDFAVESHAPLTFVIRANPLAVGEACHWHKAVFERLFTALVWPRVQVDERSCCGRGEGQCRFHIQRQV